MSKTEREGMIEPDDVSWFPRSEFSGYLWGFEDAVWISLIESRSPGNGSLSKLFKSIWDGGRAVVVPTPFSHMQAILEAKGFAHSIDAESGADIWTKQPQQLSAVDSFLAKAEART